MTAAAVPLLSPAQRRIVFTAWVTYAAYYLGRVNLATAIPDIQVDLGFSARQVGLISTGFFWAYAVGQLINGQLGNVLSPRRLVFLGMLLSAALNLVFGAASAWLFLLLLWSLNGYFQATGWGPILQLLSNWLSDEQRRSVSAIFGSCFVAGNALTWLLTGWLIANLGWRAAFTIPAVLMAAGGLAWYAAVRDNPQEKVDRHTHDSPMDWSGRFFSGLLGSVLRFWPLVLAAVFLGFALVSIIIWTPTYFVQVGGLEIGPASTLSALLPFAGIAGTLAIGWFTGRYLAQRESGALAVLLVLLAVFFAAYPLFPFQLVLSTAALMLIGALLYGASSLLLTLMPMILGGEKETSGTAGLIDFSFNIGAGLSGGIVGLMLDRASWEVVFLALAAAVVLCAFFVFITSNITGPAGQRI